jgi:hypothetical protein
MLLEGFEPAVPASERLQTHALDGVVTGIGRENVHSIKNDISVPVVPIFELFLK